MYDSSIFLRTFPLLFRSAGGGETPMAWHIVDSKGAAPEVVGGGTHLFALSQIVTLVNSGNWYNTESQFFCHHQIGVRCPSLPPYLATFDWSAAVLQGNTYPLLEIITLGKCSLLLKRFGVSCAP